MLRIAMIVGDLESQSGLRMFPQWEMDSSLRSDVFWPQVRPFQSLTSTDLHSPPPQEQSIPMPFSPSKWWTLLLDFQGLRPGAISGLHGVEFPVLTYWTWHNLTRSFQCKSANPFLLHFADLEQEKHLFVVWYDLGHRDPRTSFQCAIEKTTWNWRRSNWKHISWFLNFGGSRQLSTNRCNTILIAIRLCLIPFFLASKSPANFVKPVTCIFPQRGQKHQRHLLLDPVLQRPSVEAQIPLADVVGGHDLFAHSSVRFIPCSQLDLTKMKGGEKYGKMIRNPWKSLELAFFITDDLPHYKFHTWCMMCDVYSFGACIKT